jgi:hypothetical protein
MMSKLVKTFLISALMLPAFSSDLYARDDFSYTIRTTDAQITLANGAAKINGGEESFVPGAPQVGYKVIRVILPGGTEIESLSIETNKPILVTTNLYLDFTRGDIKTDMSPNVQATAPNPEIYSSDFPYPSERAILLSSGYWGNIHLADIAVYPLAYRAKSRQLELFSEIQLIFKLRPISPELSARLKGDPIAYSALMQSAENKNDLFPYASSNMGDVSNPVIAGLAGPEHLVITSDSLADGFQYYVDWKNQKGLPSRIVSIENILASSEGIDPPEKLRNYLIGAHEQGVRWVLLGGDEDIIPIRYLYAGNADSIMPPAAAMQIGDIYYSDLTGNWDADSDGVWGETVHDQRDIYPEIYVGRVPVRNAAEAAIWSDKAVTYEKNPGYGDPSYLNKALVICADEMRDLNQHNTVAYWLSHNFTVDATRLIEEPSGSSLTPTQPTGQQVIDVMQEGWGFITNQNHGDFSYYAARTADYNVSERSDVWGDTVLFEFDAGYSHLVNNNKPGIHYSTSCDVGAIDFDKGVFYPGPYYTTYSLAESFLAQPGGGAAFLGYTRWGWISGSLTLESKFIRRVLVDSTCNLGVAEALSKVDYPTYSDIIYGHNLFGDPEMPFWISVDGVLSIDGPEEVMTKQNHVILFHVFSGDNPAIGARVCLYKRDEIFLVENTNGQGEVSFEIEPESLGVMAVTATLPRYIPAQKLINIESFMGTTGEQELPEKPELSQNYPNPFNSNTIISFSIPQAGRVRMEIYDIGGRLVKHLTDMDFTAGANQVIWNGTNDNETEVASGLYFYKFECEEYSKVSQMTLIR